MPREKRKKTPYDTECAEPECEGWIPNHYWGHVKASGWFFSRAEHKAYCPEHVPDWVAEWRAKRDSSKTS